MKEELLLRVVYVANVIVAGWIGISSLFFPRASLVSVFQNSIDYSESIRLVGALWMAICVLSILGLFFPYKMSAVLLIQLFYKSSWLLVCALPAINNNVNYPKAMAVFFIVWVIVLPFVIPWRYLFS
jgi:hypothetical protein